MPRVSIYADRDELRDGVARLLRTLDEIEVLASGRRPPRRLTDFREGDLLVLGLDLPIEERLRVLGDTWRSNHPPRILFLAIDDEDAPDGAGRIDEGDVEPCLEAIRDLLTAARNSSRVSVRIRPDHEDASPISEPRRTATAMPLASSA